MAISRLCSIPDCGKPAKYKKTGWCGMHYNRWSKYGDPLAGRTPNGEAESFYSSVVVPYQGNECLVWPYIRDHNGYARLNVSKADLGRKVAIVSRMLCEDIYGPPPTPDHEAAHSCGNGHLACVTKGHLSWKTRADNRDDMIVHGTIAKGERNGHAKLTEKQAKEILDLKGKELNRVIAERYGVSLTTISDIQRGRSWAILR